MPTDISNDPVVVIGVDPGLVHSGVVRFQFCPGARSWQMSTQVIPGLDCSQIVSWVRGTQYHQVFIEAYRPRSHFSQDERMVQAVGTLREGIPGSMILNNTGVKQVVTQELLELLGVWRFSTVTHHQDLRAAARIGLFGLLKNPEWNTMFAQLVQDQLDGNPWEFLTL